MGAKRRVRGRAAAVSARLESGRKQWIGGPMRRDLIDLLGDEQGATALEYGLMAAAVAGVIILVAYFLGGRISNKLNNVAQHL